MSIFDAGVSYTFSLMVKLPTSKYTTKYDDIRNLPLEDNVLRFSCLNNMRETMPQDICIV